MEKKSKIYVAGHNGLVGSAIVRKLVSEGYDNLVFRNSSELDLRDNGSVTAFFENEIPEYVFFAAGTVGGIMANIKYPADFIYNNIAMAVNVIEESYKNKVKKLLYLGSSCIYPKNANQPIKEECLMSGELEETNKPFAIAKLAGIELCQAYNKQYGTSNICLIPSNVFGINDNYDFENSHLVAALIRKIYEAKNENKPFVKLWGTGRVLREALCSDELAEACLFFMNKYSGSDVINIGSGLDYYISDLAQMIKEISGYEGTIEFDTSKPDGMYKKQLDVSRAAKLGWKTKGDLIMELTKTYNDFVANYNKYCMN
ncbi:GDP-L-fucose synthase [bacterium]|nr:GDP-L-fucose synthase [bacterium]